MTCKSDNVFDKPLIDHHYLTDPDDYDRKVRDNVSIRTTGALIITGTDRGNEADQTIGTDRSVV